MQYGDLSVLPSRWFFGKPQIGEEMPIEIEKGKVLTIKLLAIGPLSAETGQREVFFELNGETRAVVIQDSHSAVEVVTREKAIASEPGSVSVQDTLPRSRLTLRLVPRWEESLLRFASSLGKLCGVVTRSRLLAP